VLVIGGKEEKYMKTTIKYTKAPKEVEESLERSVIIPNFAPTPEGVKELADKRAKKPVSIYLSVETIEKFKAAAEKNGGRYQTMISNVLDTYTQLYL
jgi:predicted DNA binding CopG/RHH family protein